MGDGSDYGVHFEYAEKPSPDGLAQAFIIGEKFIGNDSACLVLGDNIFYGAGFTGLLRQAVRDAEENGKANVFGYWVNDPERYGVAEFDRDGNYLSIEEKPKQPKSNYAVVGLYFYPNMVVNVSKNIKPSARGELEITTVNQDFLKDGELMVQVFGRGFAVLGETAVFQYKCDEFYHPEAEGGISILDESLGIDWRIPTDKAILSEKDTKHPL